MIPGAASDSELANQIWKPNFVRLFISHRSSAKSDVHNLAERLATRSVHGFVAHEHIEPSEDWLIQIKLALSTMHAMLFYVTDDFFKGPWPNQEVGYAVASSVPIVILRIGEIEPEGLIRHMQAINGNPADHDGNANKVLEILLKKCPDAGFLRAAIIASFVKSESYFDAYENLLLLERLKKITPEEALEIATGYNTNPQLFGCIKIHMGNRFTNWFFEASGKEWTFQKGKIQI